MIILFTAPSVACPMPIVTVSMYSGRTQREKDRLAETITEDVVKVLNVDKKEVVILFQKHPMEIGMFLAFVFDTLHS